MIRKIGGCDLEGKVNKEDFMKGSLFMHPTVVSELPVNIILS